MRKKVIAVAVTIIAILLVFLLYVGIHAYLNGRLIEKYAADYEKNALGDYCYSESGYTFALHETPLFSFSTNLSIAESEGNVDVLIWINLFGNVKEIGTIIVDETGASYQILLDRDFNPIDVEDSDVVEGVKPKIEVLKELAENEWGI